MADTKQLKVIIGGDAKGVQGASKKAQSSLTGLQKTANTLGTAMIGAFGGAALIAGIGRAISKIAEFEKTMRRVAIISKGSEKDLSNLALTLGKTTVFTAKQAGDAMMFLAQAGFDSNKILKATPGILELAAAANLDLARAADIASNVLSAYGMRAAEINKVNDILVNTANSANTTVEQFAESFKFVGPLAKSAGLALEETATQIGLLGNAGIQGSVAGTGLKGVLLALLNPNEALQAKLNATGKQIIKNADGSINLAETLIQLKEAHFTAEEAAASFGRIALSSALVMIDAADSADTLRGNIAEVGTAAETSKKQLDTLSGDIDLLASAWDGLVMEGSALNDVFRFGVQAVTNLINGFDEFAKAGFNLVTMEENLAAQAKEAAKAAEDHANAQAFLGEVAKLTTEQIRTINDAFIQGNVEGERAAGVAELLAIRVKKEAEELAKANQEWGEYTRYIQSANDALSISGEGIISFSDSLGGLIDRTAQSNNLLASYANWQKTIATHTKKAQGIVDTYEGNIAKRSSALLNIINATTFALGESKNAWKSMGNVALNIVQQIINAKLAEAIARMIAGESSKGLIGLATAAIGIAGIKTMFNNIPGFAMGTSFAPGGAALVGERGPEMVSLPRGSSVTPNHKLGMGGVTVNVSGFVGSPTELARQIEIVLNNESSNVRRTSFL